MTKDYFSTQARDYAKFRPTYPEVLYKKILDNTPGREIAWDCGTGNGQVAKELSASFEHVIATDISAAQLSQAPSSTNIEYRVASASHSRISADSVDLITVAQAMHWFDIPNFFKEAYRVAKPNAKLAIWGYQYPTIQNDIDKAFEAFYDGVIKEFWPPERELVDSAYEFVHYPFTEVQQFWYTIDVEWTKETFLSFVGTGSAVNLYRKELQTDPLDFLKENFDKLWDDQHTKKVSFPGFLYLVSLDSYTS